MCCDVLKVKETALTLSDATLSDENLSDDTLSDDTLSDETLSDDTLVWLKLQVLHEMDLLLLSILLNVALVGNPHI